MNAVIVCDNCEEHIEVNPNTTLGDHCCHCHERYADRNGKVLILEIEGEKTYAP